LIALVEPLEASRALTEGERIMPPAQVQKWWLGW
jgi:hypothetical protein